MSSKTYSSCVVLLLALYVQACENHSNSANSFKPPQENTEDLKKVSPESNPEQTVKMGGISSSDVVGVLPNSPSSRVYSSRYTSTCELVGNSQSRMEELVFYGPLEMHHLVEYFADIDCKNATHITSEKSMIEYLTHSDDNTQVTFKSLLKDITWDVYTAQQAGIYNSSKLCGLSNWSTNKTQAVGGLTCGDKTFGTINTYKYDIGKFENSTITLGDQPSYGEEDNIPSKYSVTIFNLAGGEKENPFAGK